MRNIPLPLLALILVCGMAARFELAEVDLVAPADGSETVAVAPTFRWSSVDGSDSYELEVATKRNMRQPVINATDIQGTSFTPSSPLSQNETYFWRARAVESNGAPGPWSRVWSFDTGQLPAQTTLSLPQHQSTGISLTPEFAWNSVSLADSYDFEMSLNSDFSSVVESREGLTQTTLSPAITLDPQTRYYWRVRTSNTVGDGPYSNTAWFETLAASPSQVALEYPGDGATDVETSLTFAWASADGAESYRIEVASTSSFSSPLIDESGLASTSFAVPSPLLNGSLFYWRVRAANALGDGPISSVRTFTTVTGGATQVSLVSPPDESQDVELTPTLSWQSVAGASSYRVQVSTRSDFSGDFVHDTVVGGTQFQVGPLSLGGTYFWRVRASNAGIGNWSEVFEFATGASAPAQIVLISPPDGAVDQPLEPVLTWADSDLAETYNLQIGLSADFSTILVSETGLTSTSYTAEDLDALNDYYWRVQGVNEAGSGSWSQGRRFTTRVVLAPAAPTLIYPPDGAEGVALNPVVSWNESEGAASYKLELSTSPPDELENFITVVTAVVVAEPFFQSPDLSGGQVHYWRVEARNEGGSARSVVRTFTTAAPTASESERIATDFALDQNYPNPFNSTTTVVYELPEAVDIRLEVLDMLGRVVESLVIGHQSAGKHSVVWNATNHTSGIYYYRIEAGELVSTKKMVLTR